MINLENLPSTHPISWFKEQLVDCLESNKARVLVPSIDMTIRENFLVLILDGWHPLKEALEENAENNLESEEEDETVEIVAKPPVIEAEPENFSCGVCTFENPISKKTCEICDSPRPPMEDIKAQFKESMAPAQEEKGD